MPEGVCLECGAEMPYDWAPCPQCGWKAPNAWEMDGEPEDETIQSPGMLSSPRPWIGLTVWVLIGFLVLGLFFFILRHL
jgi:hypothetical protein